MAELTQDEINELNDEEFKEMFGFDREPKMVPKKIRCPLCKGSGTFVSPKTGVRAATAAEPLTDDSRPCVKCGGKKFVVIKITEEQADREKKEAERKRKAKREKINADAKAAREAADKEDWEK